jgi:hypothetical protein
MRHRHLESVDYSLTSIDDLIARGLWDDWAELRDKALADGEILDGIERVCQHYISDPHEQRHHFWNNYVRKQKQKTG